jgi:hypothetical protein
MNYIPLQPSSPGPFPQKRGEGESMSKTVLTHFPQNGAAKLVLGEGESMTETFFSDNIFANYGLSEGYKTG